MPVFARSVASLFIADTVQFIVSGLALMLLVWLIWKEPAKREEWARWLVGFSLLAGSFGLDGWTSYRLLADVEGPALATLSYTVGGLLETAGLATIGWALLARVWGRWAALGLLAVALELGGLWIAGPNVEYLPSVWHGVAAAAAAAFGLAGVLARARHELPYAGIALLLVVISHVSTTLSDPALIRQYAWGLATTVNLFGLAGLALAVERKSQDLFTPVFLRLNLTFIFLAAVLMVLAAQADRNRREEFARQSFGELGEFLRGHIMFYMNSGGISGDPLTSPTIFRRIVSDFGHHPDLRVVRIRTGQREVSVSIDEDGMITQRLASVSQSPPSPSDRSPTVVVAEWPIFSDAAAAGAVVFEETRRSVDRQVAESILIIFAAFTSAVAIGSLLIGAIVYGASERLQRQVGKIERSERQLMQSAKLASIGEMVSGVAHEINNPLGVLTSRIEYLRELAGDQPETQSLLEDVDVINRQAGQISRIVQGLLSFARPHALEFCWVDVGELVRRSADLAGAGRFRAAHIRLHVSLPPSLPQLRADPDRLEQVIVNLINNAADAMPEGGDLHLAARADGQQIQLSVSDTGSGIPEEDQKRIFDPFFSTKGGRGTGLGLSVSYGIIRDHGGEIRVESRVGAGSTFVVVLPAETNRA